MSDQQTATPSIDSLISRCEDMDWGYELACWVDYAEMMGGGARIAVDRTCRAEVTAPNGVTSTIDDTKTGHEALARAVTSMESVLARQATVGRKGEAGA